MYRHLSSASIFGGDIGTRQMLLCDDSVGEGMAMQQDILIIGVLFPAIPLMMVNFGNRYTVLANLIRHLHDEVIRDNVSPNDAESSCCRSTASGTAASDWHHQSCAAILCLALGAMIAAYFDERVESSILFLGSILLMMGSMLLFTREIQIANTALDVHLSDLETHQEWEQYLKPKRRRRNTAAKT